VAPSSYCKHDAGELWHSG